MRVNDIFYSLQGEGLYVGTPTVFIRLQGCNLRCKYCDTLQGQDVCGGVESTVEEIVEVVRSLNTPPKTMVCITGGEPLMQLEELEKLVLALWPDYDIEIETNGSYPVPEWSHFVTSWSVDCKCPSSGMVDTLRLCWVERGCEDQFKFVVSCEKDLDYVSYFIDTYNIGPTILVSPVIGKTVSKRWLQRVAVFCKQEGIRLSVQMHKIIWGNKESV